MSLRSALLDTSNPFNWLARFKAQPQATPSGPDTKLLRIAGMDSGDYWKQLLGRRHISQDLLRKLLKDVPMDGDDDSDYEEDLTPPASPAPATPMGPAGGGGVAESKEGDAPTVVAQAAATPPTGEGAGGLQPQSLDGAMDAAAGAGAGGDDTESLGGGEDLLRELNSEHVNDAELKFVGRGEKGGITATYNGEKLKELDGENVKRAISELEHRRAAVLKGGEAWKRIDRQLANALTHQRDLDVAARRVEGGTE